MPLQIKCYNVQILKSLSIKTLSCSKTLQIFKDFKIFHAATYPIKLNSNHQLYRYLKLGRSLSDIPSPQPNDAPNIKPKLSNPGKGNDSSKKSIFTWKTLLVTLGFGGVAVIGINYLKNQKDIEIDKVRKQEMGKMLIGGDWELINTEGKIVTNKDFLGKWVLLYFGFTHCPDICPDEMEKMCKVVDIIQNEKNTGGGESKTNNQIPIVPLFVSVDPERDSPKIVKQYCEEFSPKLIGLTGTLDQIKDISKTFRVYYSQGPRDKRNDYIVDHTIITYLINPKGNFVDYFGRTKTAEDMVSSIKLQALKYNKAHSKFNLFSFR